MIGRIRLVCLDKDGTLVENVPYNADPAAMRLAPGADEALPALRDAGFHLVVVSNQPGVGLGRFPESALAGVERRLRELCAAAGADLDGFYYCPHAPLTDGAPRCACRKPLPGLVQRALADHDADPRASWMVGDILDDVEAGRRAGCRTVLVDNGNETEWVAGPMRRADHVVADLAEAARLMAAASTGSPAQEVPA